MRGGAPIWIPAGAQCSRPFLVPFPAASARRLVEACGAAATHERPLSDRERPL